MDVESTIQFILATEARIASKLEALTEHMDRAEARLEGVEARLAGAEARLEGAESRLERIEADLQSLIGVVGQQQAQISGILGAVGAVTERMQSLAHLFEDWLRRGGDGSRPS